MFATLSNNNANVYDSVKLIITCMKLTAIMVTEDTPVIADIAMKYFTIIKRAQHHQTCVPCVLGSDQYKLIGL